jgi:hypothetical protein
MKKMKAPEKTLPVEAAATAGSANAPDIEISNMNFSSLVDDTSAPSQAPPEIAIQGGAFGAAVWANDKRVNGLYNTYHARNSWMSIAGTGWVKLATATDSACESMTILATHARIKQCRMDYAVENGITVEMYVW